eukprot:TRINITY_DN5969_c0_g1_i2.p1 TRINITY_DN5969_c0_g1~~TRINITY_DN5969_c0_g1_i2.p1  ORF type:complete len:407 (-),score=127.43 TRINITY_DN5969_c0_g1_i2:185-1405(-)
MGSLENGPVQSAARSRNTPKVTTQQPVEKSSRQKLIEELRQNRKRITLFRAPFTTLYIFSRVVLSVAKQYLLYLLTHRLLLSSILLITTVVGAGYAFPGAHSEYLDQAENFVMFVAWWLVLGIASSIGLGTGLHTFVLFLGPYIAKATMAATECGTLDFATEGPDAFLCPDVVGDVANITFWQILSKVQLACILWGAGTAIGELPPYFMARAARLQGEKLAELEELEEEVEVTFLDHMKHYMHRALQKWGFMAIVICASVPNPLFDLAGLTCGHFLVPFWTFFGATFIGKAIIKVHLQSFAVITVFYKDRLNDLIAFILWLTPASIHHSIEPKVNEFFQNMKAQYHKNEAHLAPTAQASRSLLSSAWDIFLGGMLLWFLISIINASVQEKLVELDEKKIKELDDQS